GLATDPGHDRAVAQLKGFGSILCVGLPTSAAAQRATEAVSLWTPARSLGGVESLIERRRRHAHEPHSVTEGLLRRSVGIENVDDLCSGRERAVDTALAAT